MKNHIKKTNLVQILEEITDFRNPNLIEYTIPEVLIVVMIGVLAGLKHTLHIDMFAKAHANWFKEKLGLEHIPSHDTMDRVLAFINYKELDAALTIWLDNILQNKHLKKLIRKRLMVDGKKTDKNSKNRTTVVRAFLGSIKQVKGVERIIDFHNEITAIPKLIKKLFLKGYLVSIDAIGTQVEIAKLLLSKGAHYLLPVKRNQKALYEDIKLFVDTEIKDKSNKIDIFENTSKGHGRIEKRKVYAFKNTAWIIERNPLWNSIKSFCLLESTRQQKNKDMVTTYRIYISDLILSAAEFLDEIRSHWSIENNLHWPLNQSFEENKILSKNSFFIMNFTLLLTTSLTITSHTKENRSFNLQRLCYSWDLDQTLKALF